MAAELIRRVTKEKPRDLIKDAVVEYKKGSLTPELVNKTWQTIWKTWGEGINHKFQVPSCDRTSEELGELQKEGKAVLLVPDELYTKEGLVLLGGMFPKMGDWSVSEGTKVKNRNGYNKGGSIDIEMHLDSPHRNTTEKEAMNILKIEGRTGQRLATYVVGSQFSKFLTDHYFDENTWSRLPGSRLGGYDLNANFRSDGHLSAFSTLYGQYANPYLGFHSEGVKKA